MVYSQILLMRFFPQVGLFATDAEQAHSRLEIKLSFSYRFERTTKIRMIVGSTFYA